MRVSVYRKAHFNAAHRLHNDNWSPEKNQAVFGKCNNPKYHGHNYVLEVKLTGEVNTETGFLYDLGKLKEIISLHIEDRFDHKNLNEECEEFSNLNPSVEHIAYVIYNILREKIEDCINLRVKLWETPRNYAAYPG